jgi:hypothetical protein
MSLYVIYDSTSGTIYETGYTPDNSVLTAQAATYSNGAYILVTQHYTPPNAFQVRLSDLTVIVQGLYGS